MHDLDSHSQCKPVAGSAAVLCIMYLCGRHLSTSKALQHLYHKARHDKRITGLAADSEQVPVQKPSGDGAPAAARTLLAATNPACPSCKNI